MEHKLVIAEKPSVAVSIVKIIGANNKKDDYYKGNGPYQIDKILTEEKIERPSYYLAQRGMGNHTSNYNSAEPYLWRGTTGSNILSRQEYMGHTVNFRTYKSPIKANE